RTLWKGYPMATNDAASPGHYLRWLAMVIVLYHILIVGNLLAALGYFVPEQVHHAISLAAALVPLFITVGARGKKHGAGGRRKLTPFDVLLILSVLVSSGYVVFLHDEILAYSMYGYLDTTGIVLVLMLCLPLFEAVRRATGWALPTLVTVLILTTVFQPYLPGILHGRGYDPDRLLYSAYVGEAGIFGLPLGVAAEIILVFLLFGALMDVSGTGQWFLKLALALTGWARGGPAKAAVVASAMFGSISGSPSANAATTGVFTIPLMKQIGYRASFAGAVEAVASTGGQILPPVMGAIAFIMAEWIGRTYVKVVFAALVPALLYFLVVFVSVHLQARRDGLKALPRADLPRFGAVFREGWFYLIPIAALIYFLIVEGFPPGMAGILTLPFVIASSFLSKERKFCLSLASFGQACEQSVRSWITIAAITGFVGIMIDAVELSGIGIKIFEFILDLSQGDLYLTLLLVGISSLILGMGLDAIPAYITLATLMAPADQAGRIRHGGAPVRRLLGAGVVLHAAGLHPPFTSPPRLAAAVCEKPAWRRCGSASPRSSCRSPSF
ncbi:MAG: TRAP transporter permease, partial [Alphaproteobacteria bacterium]